MEMNFGRSNGGTLATGPTTLGRISQTVETGGTDEATEITKAATDTSERTRGRVEAEVAVRAGPIIWALEAFPDQDELHLKTAAALARLFPHKQIIPVYVLSEESFVARGFSTFLKPALKPMATKALATILQDVRDLDSLQSLRPNMRRPRVLIEASASRMTCAEKLLRFARKTGASGIALGSHARRGIGRFFVGSFSDAVLDSSPVPVIVAGPHASAADSRITTVVFPTDFSASCRQALPEILNLCANIEADLHVFHKPVPAMDTYYAQAGVGLFGGSWVTIDGFMTEPFDEHPADVHAWMAHARARGIKTTFVAENFREPTAEAIIQYTNRLGSTSTLVAMVSQTTKTASAFLGSVTRDVIRAGRCPVYVVPHSAH